MESAVSEHIFFNIHLIIVVVRRPQHTRDIISQVAEHMPRKIEGLVYVAAFLRKTATVSWNATSRP